MCIYIYICVCNIYIYIYVKYINTWYIIISMYDMIYIYIWYICMIYIYIYVRSYDTYIYSIYIYMTYMKNKWYEWYVCIQMSIYLYMFPFIFPVNTLGPWTIRPMRRDFPQRFACSEDPAVRCVRSSSETLRQRRPNETSQALGKCQQCHWGHNTYMLHMECCIYIYICIFTY